MSSRWVLLTWKAVSPSEKIHGSEDGGQAWATEDLPISGRPGRQWEVKARCVVHGFEDYQESSVDAYFLKYLEDGLPGFLCLWQFVGSGSSGALIRQQRFSKAPIYEMCPLHMASSGWPE